MADYLSLQLCINGIKSLLLQYGYKKYLILDHLWCICVFGQRKATEDDKALDDKTIRYVTIQAQLKCKPENISQTWFGCRNGAADSILEIILVDI
jgi:hypothetical protein